MSRLIILTYFEEKIFKNKIDVLGSSELSINPLHLLEQLRRLISRRRRRRRRRRKRTSSVGCLRTRS